jgi:hypothetical protein
MPRALNAPARSHRRPHPASWARQPDHAAPGASARGVHQATPVGSWCPRCCRTRPGLGCNPLAARRGHGPGGGAPGTCPPSLSPPWTRPRAATWAAPGQRPAVTSRPRPVVGTPGGCGTLGALPAGPPGARPPAGGSAQSAVPPRLRPGSCPQRAARSPHTRPGGRVWHTPTTRMGPPGVCTRAWRRGRPGAAGRAPGPSPRWRRAGTSRASSTPDTG